MQINEGARKLVGFLIQHAKAFQEVANNNRCIIMSRAPGQYVPGLVEEGYASKGYHNKTKSCNWGPMAGFVMTKPLFSKAGILSEKEYDKQSGRILKALKSGAQPIQLHISEKRRSALEQGGIIKRNRAPTKGTSDEKGKRIWRYNATMKDCKGELRGEAANYNFTLKEKIIDGKTVWAVYYAMRAKEKKLAPKPKTIKEARKEVLVAAKALKDSNWTQLEVMLEDGVETEIIRFGTTIVVLRGGGLPSYKRATTGDYDLFGIWPYIGNAARDQPQYRRKVGAADLYDASELELSEDPEQGNISPYIQGIATQLNHAVSQRRWGRNKYRYLGGNMVHHSDEAGRPFMDDIDLPFIAFFPSNPKFGNYPPIAAFETVEEFSQLIDTANKAKFRVELNPGWIKDLKGRKGMYRNFLIKAPVKVGL